jgi:hypothetical protein
MVADAKTVGFDELAKRVNMLRTQKEVDTVSYRGTFGVAKETKNAAIVNAWGMFVSRSGDLIRNIAQKRIRIGTKVGYTVGVRANTRRQIKSGNNPFYWWWVHFGKMGEAPRPFLSAAWKQIEGKAASTIIEQGKIAIAGSVERALRKYPNPPDIGRR